MQRLHLDDLVGHVLEKEHWDVIDLPAIATDDEVWDYGTLQGPARRVRLTGDVLHPEREPKEILEALRRMLGEYVFSAQYLQAPVPLGGGIVKAEWLQYYEKSECPEEFDRIIQSWDTANKESQLSDFSVCTTYGLKDKHIYLLHVLCKRLNYPDLKRAVHEQAGLWRPRTILIEDKASGTQLIQELSRESLNQVKGIKPEHDKVMRMSAQTATIENGFYHLPKDAPWLASYVQELTTFPKAKYDDQVDSTSQALAWIFEAGREPGIITFYKQECERLGIPLPPMPR
jgi:predicted phage terminase large subunit-like protein